MQNPLKALYPDQCAACGALVEGSAGLCAPCWAGTPFLSGLTCDACGVPLLGEAGGARPLCDDCLAAHPPWSRGRTVLAYDGNARRIVLSVKHGDRLDLVRPVASWMASRAADLLSDDSVLVPVPLHWTRLLSRRFNQAALLAREIGRLRDVEAIPDGLVRTRRTRPQERMTKPERQANQAGAIRANPSRASRISGRSVILVDDVMTSGATLAEAARAVHAAGARGVSVVTLARVVKEA